MARTALAALLLLAACGAEPPAAPEHRSVVLLTIDTLRPDHVGTGTPAISKFLEGAVHYRGARTVAPLTLPSHLSILSGLHPARTGIHDNSTSILPGTRSYPLLPEEFAKAGYETAAFVAAHVLDAPTGIAAGFALYEQYRGSTRGAPYLQADEQTSRALKWLEGRTGPGPFFLWVHYYDPHAPYLPFAGDALRRGTSPSDPPAEIYAGEVRRVDAAIEALLARVPEEAIVVLVSDHGESLGEHGEPSHGALCYGSTADCFLAVRAPALPRGKSDDLPRSLCDIAPSLRAWCGLPEVPGDGRGLESREVPPAVTLSVEAWRVHGWGQCLSASDGRFTLVESGPVVELFDRSTDAGETRPLDPRGHEAYERLDRALQAVRALGSGGSVPQYLPESAIPYASGRRSDSQILARAENAALKDPRSRLGLWLRMEEAHQLALTGPESALDAARATLREAAAAEPENPAPLYLLADGLLERAARSKDKRLAHEAADAALAAFRLGYRTSPTLRLLLDASHGTGEVGPMRAALEAAQDERVIPDLKCLESALHVTLRLARKGDAEALALGTAFVRRSMQLLRWPEAQRRCGEMLEMLGRVQ